MVEDCLIGFLELEAVLLVAQNWQVSKLLVLLVKEGHRKETNVFIMTLSNVPIRRDFIISITIMNGAMTTKSPIAREFL